MHVSACIPSVSSCLSCVRAERSLSIWSISCNSRSRTSNSECNDLLSTCMYVCTKLYIAQPFSDSFNSAWMLETLASARAWALQGYVSTVHKMKHIAHKSKFKFHGLYLWSASISSCCLSKASLLSSMNCNPSYTKKNHQSTKIISHSYHRKNYCNLPISNLIRYGRCVCII